MKHELREECPLHKAWWGPALVLFLTSRLLNLAYLLASTSSQSVDSTKLWRQSGRERNIDLSTLMSNWDSGIYYLIAERGYPSSLPLDATGAVSMNEWAFYPLWPAILSLAHGATGLTYSLIAPVLAASFALVGILILVRLVLSSTGSKWLATSLAASLSFFPASVVFQLGYTEGLFLFLSACLLAALHARRYGWAFALVSLMAFTRPIVLVVALTLGLLWLWRAGQERRGKLDFGRAERFKLAGLSLYSTVAFSFWPLVAGLVTGEPNAYLLTQETWRFAGTDPILLTLALPWREPGLASLFAALTILLAASAWLKRDRTWPVELRIWSFAYLLYIGGTIQAGIYADGGRIDLNGDAALHPSTWRYLMLALVPVVPLHLLATERSRRTRKLVLLALFVLAGTIGSYYFTRFHVVDNVANGLYWP